LAVSPHRSRLLARAGRSCSSTFEIADTFPSRKLTPVAAQLSATLRNILVRNIRIRPLLSVK
jgi:hypothetical protein